jgi:hypothetical protein
MFEAEVAVIKLPKQQLGWQNSLQLNYLMREFDCAKLAVKKQPRLQMQTGPFQEKEIA